MDFAKALTFPFDDDDWLQKLGIAVGITLAGAILGILIIPLFVMLLFFRGWSFEILKRVKNNDPTPLPSPLDDFGGYLGKGLVLYGATLLYQLPSLLIICLYTIGVTVLGGGLAAIGEDAAAAGGGITFILTICLFCGLLLYAIFAAIVLWGGTIRYSEREEFSTFLQIGDNFALVRENIGDFGQALLFLIIGGVISSILSGTAIGAVLVTTFNGYYTGHISGQLAQQVLGGGVEPPPAALDVPPAV